MKGFFINVTVALLVSLICIYTYHILTNKPIGYVKTGVVLQKYEAMIAANKQYEAELAVVQGNVDTLRNRYERLKAAAQQTTPAQKADWGYRLGIAEKEYGQYNQTAQQQLQQRQKELAGNVINKVNTFIQTYGQQHHYKIIFGTTSEGSILYGLDQDDLTEEVLSALNQNYQKEKPAHATAK